MPFKFQTINFSFLKLQRQLSFSAIVRRSKVPECKEVKIGNVSKVVKEPQNPLLVPVYYFPKEPKKSLIHHFQWILKKDLLGQDMFLITLPGSFRGRLILAFLEMMQREAEYVLLTRDTTENDLKQRREIFDGTEHLVDQSAVKAAIEGRSLVLDGVEKVERNVLNNLLENTQDGRFLVAPTVRDLLQQRITDRKGNTLWRSTQLVQAAESGKLLVLDVLQLLLSGTFSVVRRLVQDREMQLYAGTRLLRHDRYDTLKQALNSTDTIMKENQIIRVHPSFRIIALSEPAKSQSMKDNWINAELLSIFLFHSIMPLSLQEEKIVIEKMVGNVSDKMKSTLKFTQKLRNSEDDALKNLSASLLTRQLVRMTRRLSSYPDSSVRNLTTQSCLTKFLPSLTKQERDDPKEEFYDIAIRETSDLIEEIKKHPFNVELMNNTLDYEKFKFYLQQDFFVYSGLHSCFLDYCS